MAQCEILRFSTLIFFFKNTIPLLCCLLHVKQKAYWHEVFSYIWQMSRKNVITHFCNFFFISCSRIAYLEEFQKWKFLDSPDQFYIHPSPCFVYESLKGRNSQNENFRMNSSLGCFGRYISFFQSGQNLCQLVTFHQPQEDKRDAGNKSLSFTPLSLSVTPLLQNI